MNDGCELKWSDGSWQLEKVGSLAGVGSRKRKKKKETGEFLFWS